MEQADSITPATQNTKYYEHRLLLWEYLLETTDYCDYQQELLMF